MKNIFKILPIFCLFCFFCFCAKQKDIISIDSITVINTKKNDAIDFDWHLKDIIKDTIAGISLNKVYDHLIKDKKGQEVVVAVIDTEIDMNHEDLIGSFWVNSDEIPNNAIDDDDNGYIDDINGWNFLGSNNGENVIFSNYEIIRIIRKYDALFKDKSLSEIDQSLEDQFGLYQKALGQKDIMKSSINNTEKRARAILNRLGNATVFFDSIYKTQKITLELAKSYQPPDSITAKFKKDMVLFLNGGLTKDILETLINQQKGLLEKSLDIDYKERAIIGDDPDNIKDVPYGTPNVSSNLKEFYHGTLVSGILTAKRHNVLGIDGISDNILVMPLAISANGDEHDKDIALAIRYAVDNGADIINMSSGKPYSLHKEWVQEAITYASDNNVLFVTSAGNDNLNLDSDQNQYYPNDNVDNVNEISKSFIMVGASGTYPDENFKYRSSNYGKQNVDIFAPGVGLKTTIPFNNYRKGNATSVATPIVSGVSALIKSYYPDFTAAEIKDILLKSGTTYHISVKVTLEDGTKKLVPFSELSKSGKVVNAYNALLMAEQITKAKK